MIALDTSAVVAIALEEPEADAYAREIALNEAVIGAPTLLECRIVLTSRMPRFGSEFVTEFVAQRTIRASAFTVEMFDIAAVAFDRFGKGRGHPAQLNFGDCLAYAVAKQFDVPLLFKGEDFPLTDILSAIRRE